jgi:putative restriction endonuclease
VTVTPDLRFEVSKRLKEDFENGRSYYPLHGSTLQVPRGEEEKPAANFLRWHNVEMYLG